MKKLLLFLIITCSLSCREESSEEDSSDELIQLSDTIQVRSEREVSLLPEAQTQVSDWLAYATAHNQIEDLKTATGRELVSNSQPMVQIMETLKSSLPDSLQQNAVVARTNVLVTKAHVLNQAATKKDIDVEEVFNAANDIILEFDNFKIQLNELYLKTPEDFEVELDRQFEERRDSLQRVQEAEKMDSVLQE